MTNSQHNHLAVGYRKDNTMGRTTSKSEEQLPDTLIKKITLGRKGAAFGHLLERSDFFVNAQIPATCLSGRTVFSPPVVRRLDISFRGARYDNAIHLCVCRDAIFGAKLTVKRVKLLHIARAPRVDAFLDRLTLLVGPIERVQGLANHVGLGNAREGNRPLLDPLEKLLWQINLHSVAYPLNLLRKS